MGGVVVLEVPGDPGVAEGPGVAAMPGIPGVPGTGVGVGEGVWRVISAGDDTVKESQYM